MNLLRVNILTLIFSVFAACSHTGDEYKSTGKDDGGQALILFEKKEHLTQKGVKKLRKIQKGMNIRRRIKK